MKNRVTSFDVYAIVNEFQFLVNSYIDKIYQPSKDELFIKINTKGGKKVVYIKVGRFICISERERKSEELKPFAMLLRKYIRNGRIEKIEQLGFDRIVLMKIRKESEYNLIIELFGDGNVILLKENEIVQPLFSQTWAHRVLRKGVQYTAPPSSNPLALTFEEFGRVLRKSERDLVRTLAVDINLGGLYAEEICLISKVDKHASTSELNDEKTFLIFKSLQRLVELLKTPKPCIVYDDERKIDVLPFPLKIYGSKNLKEFKSFNDALDEFFIDVKEIKPSVTESIIERYERQAEQQRTAIKKFESEIEENRSKGEFIYTHYAEIEEIVDRIIEVKDREGWEGARKIRDERIKELKLREGNVVLSLKDNGKTMKIRLDLKKNLQQNAQVYYERAKRLKEKLDGARRALDETMRRIENARIDDAKARREKVMPTKQFWFEKYRWCFSSEGNLILAGRDAKTNDQVVKSHLKDNDRYCHANIHGAPSVVVKRDVCLVPINSDSKVRVIEGKISEQTLREACIFALTFSKAWSSKIGDAESYWVLPEQVSKTPQSGEFLAKGAFVIRGKRNYIKNLKLELGIGEVRIEGSRKLMCSPLDAIKVRSERYFTIEPGDIDKNSFAKALSKIFRIPVEEILRVLPSGGFRVAGAVGVEFERG